MATPTRTTLAAVVAAPVLMLATGGVLAQASFDDLAAAVDEQATQNQSASDQRKVVPRNAAPTRPLLHSYGATPRVSVNIGVPLGRHGYATSSPAYGYYGRGHLGFRGHFRGTRGYYRGGRYCPPGFYGRRGRW